jgi:hypothetical protein
MGIVAKFGELQTLDFSSTSPVYTEVGNPINHPASIFTIQNLTDADMMFSTDGVIDNIWLSPFSAYVQDITASHPSSDTGLYVPKLTQVWVKQATGAAASKGSVNVMYTYDASF